MTVGELIIYLSATLLGGVLGYVNSNNNLLDTALNSAACAVVFLAFVTLFYYTCPGLFK